MHTLPRFYPSRPGCVFSLPSPPPSGRPGDRTAPPSELSGPGELSELGPSTGAAEFVDGLFETIFSRAHRSSGPAPGPSSTSCDFLDEQADKHGITRNPHIRPHLEEQLVSEEQAEATREGHPESMVKRGDPGTKGPPAFPLWQLCASSRALSLILAGCSLPRPSLSGDHLCHRSFQS